MLDFSKGRNKTAYFSMLRIHGEIGKPNDAGAVGISWDTLQESIANAFEWKEAKAVILDIDCPGGAPVATDLLAREIRRQADLHEKPVIAFVREHATSGGYWLACTADEIYALPASVIGSIGVRYKHDNKHEYMKKEGLRTHFFAAGSRKVQMEGELPVRKKDIAKIMEIMKDTHKQFKQWVSERRGDRLQGNLKDLMNGDIWAGHRALKRGLIDGIGDMHGVLIEKSGNKDVRINVFEPGNNEIPMVSSGGRAKSSLEGPTFRLYL